MATDLESGSWITPETFDKPKPSKAITPVAEPRPARGYTGPDLRYTPARAQDVSGSGGPGDTTLPSERATAYAREKTGKMPVGLSRDIYGRVIPGESSLSTIAGRTEVLPSSTKSQPAIPPQAATEQRPRSMPRRALPSPGQAGRVNQPVPESALPPAGGRYSMDKGTGPAIRPLQNRFVPIERDQEGRVIGGGIRPYQDSLGADISRATGGRGYSALPEGNAGGGNVAQFRMSAADQAAAEKRRSEGSTALDSYNRTLDEANLREGIHGADQARRIALQKQMFLQKYGLEQANINLRTAELAQRMPLLQAQTAEARAKADAYSGKNEFSKDAMNQKFKETVYKHFADDPAGVASDFGIRTKDDEGKTIPGWREKVWEKINSLGSSDKATAAAAEKPPMENAKKAPDGKWYIPDPKRPGKYQLIEG
jgi:hypothetical protein